MFASLGCRGHPEGFHIPLYSISTVATIQHTQPGSTFKVTIKYQGTLDNTSTTTEGTVTSMYAFCVWLQGFTNKICLLLKSIPLTLPCHLAPALDSLVVIKKRVRWDVFSSYLYFHSNSSQHNLSYEGWHNETTRGREEGGGAFVNPWNWRGCQRILFASLIFNGWNKCIQLAMNLLGLYVSIYNLWIHSRMRSLKIQLLFGTTIHLQSTHLF